MAPKEVPIPKFNEIAQHSRFQTANFSSTILVKSNQPCFLFGTITPIQPLSAKPPGSAQYWFCFHYGKDPCPENPLSARFTGIARFPSFPFPSPILHEPFFQQSSPLHSLKIRYHCLHAYYTRELSSSQVTNAITPGQPYSGKNPG